MSDLVWVQLDERGNGTNLDSSLLAELLTAAGYIVIPKADLPEVVALDAGHMIAGTGPEECKAEGNENPLWLRGHALSALALADHLDQLQIAKDDIDWLAVDKLQGLIGEAVQWTGDSSIPRSMAEHLVREGVVLPEHLR